jgi:molecular chaperone DnaJ
MSQDFYKLLGVEKNATQSEVKKAYRRMANKYHPDKNKGDKAAEAKFKKISEAYETISDPQKRKMYDQFGSGGPQGAGFNAQGFASQFNGAENFADIFESFFGGGFSQSKSRPRKKSTAIPGEDIEKSVQISFKDSIFGVEHSVKYRKVNKCDLCSGSGVEPGHKLNTCATCSGQGVVQEVRRSLLGQVMSTRTCSTCSGTGQVPEKKCSKCNGIKRHAVDRSLKVKVPKGIHDGAVIRITGAGNSGIGAPDGDLYVRVQVQSDKVFTRQGDDIHSDLDVPYWLAALGGEMSAETVYGQQVVKIPSGTQHGFTIPIKEKGAPSLRSETVGSHVFNVKIQIPKKLSSQEKKNLKEIKSSLTDTQKGFWK